MESKTKCTCNVNGLWGFFAGGADSEKDDGLSVSEVLVAVAAVSDFIQLLLLDSDVGVLSKLPLP